MLILGRFKRQSIFVDPDSTFGPRVTITVRDYTAEHVDLIVDNVERRVAIGDAIFVRADVKVQALDRRLGNFRLGFDAPRQVVIVRAELPAQKPEAVSNG